MLRMVKTRVNKDRCGKKVFSELKAFTLLNLEKKDN